MKSKEQEYQYSKGNLLYNPQKYQRTPFEGRNFLNAYKKQRENLFILCGSDFTLSELTNSKKYSPKKTIILEQYLHYLVNQKIIHSDDFKNEIDRWVKKFEIRKRLFTEYNLNFEEISKDFENLKNYLLLSLLCILQYEQCFSLKYLNTSLKINDMLSTQFNNINKADKPLFGYILENELKYISNICNKKGIFL